MTLSGAAAIPPPPLWRRLPKTSKSLSRSSKLSSAKSPICSSNVKEVPLKSLIGSSCSMVSGTRRFLGRGLAAFLAFRRRKGFHMAAPVSQKDPSTKDTEGTEEQGENVTAEFAEIPLLLIPHDWVGWLSFLESKIEKYSASWWL